MEFLAVGIAFVAIGAVYIKWPMIFRRGIWLKTSIAVRMLSEDNYRRYMRGFGVLLIVVGAVLILIGATDG
jgi:hypothetical protein